jgi:diguanylate cyclase (GGDEF)-like protein
LLFFMMIDLDGFKAINDAHGHLAGDTALLQVRDALLACCRQSDTVIRWGGDEFLVVGHSLGIEGMSRLAERIRRGLSARDYQVAPGQVSHLSGSIGVAPYPFAPQNTNIANWEQVVNIADRAAYVAKTNGRDGWVALHGNSNTLRTDPASVQANLGELVAGGRIELLTSIPGDLSLETTGRNAA